MTREAIDFAKKGGERDVKTRIVRLSTEPRERKRRTRSRAVVPRHAYRMLRRNMQSIDILLDLLEHSTIRSNPYLHGQARRLRLLSVLNNIEICREFLPDESLDHIAPLPAA